MASVLIALGGNVGDVRTTFRKAISNICGMTQAGLVARSSDYETPPVGDIPQDNFVNAVIKLAQLSLNGEDADPLTIQAFFKPWWNALTRQYTPMGNKRNGTLNPGQASSLII